MRGLSQFYGEFCKLCKDYAAGIIKKQSNQEIKLFFG
jgi:hypothetical protein